MAKQAANLAGQTFGMWTVIERDLTHHMGARHLMTLHMVP